MSADTIVVAALTYRRPESLRTLLDAFRALERPAASMRFLVVDNDPTASAKPVVDAWRATAPDIALDYVVEPVAGIPAARNRAIDAAVATGATLLCFTDDDARPETGWVRELFACHRAMASVLTFGPQRLEPVGVDGAWRRFLARSLVARARFMERYAARRARAGQVVLGATHNVMCELSWITRNGIRFDPSRTEGGGSDTAFREAVRAAGGRLGWCERAVVIERLPRERIGVRYQFRRARAHGITSAQVTRNTHRRPLHNATGRVAAGAMLMCVPVLGRASFTLGLHLLGMGVGMLDARRGIRSGLYERG